MEDQRFDQQLNCCTRRPRARRPRSSRRPTGRSHSLLAPYPGNAGWPHDVALSLQPVGLELYNCPRLKREMASAEGFRSGAISRARW